MMGMYKLSSYKQIFVDDHAVMYPVYKQLGGNDYLYVGGNGYWRVGPDIVLNLKNGLKCPNNDPTPPSPPGNGWRYWDDGWKDDQTIGLFPACKAFD